MADKKVFLILFLVYFNSQTVQSASLLERSYEYVVNFSRSVAPSILSILDCFGENGEGWACAREKAGKLLESWDKEVEKQRMMWAEAADAEVASSGRSLEELPSKLGKDIELSLAAVTDLVENGVARAMERKKHDSGGIDSITISTGGGEKKKKMKKKKQKPAKIHLIQPVMMPLNKMEDKGPRRVQSWIIGDLEGMNTRTGDQKGLKSGIEAVDRNGKGVEDLAGYSSDEKKYANHNVDSSYVVIDTPETQRSQERYIRDAGDENQKGDEHKSKGDEIEKEGYNNEIGQRKVLESSDGSTGVHNGVVGDRGRTGRGILTDMWNIGEKALDAVAEHALESENADNGLVDRSSIEEQRGKKKKKKKAILKLLILGAVLKAKIGTLLQILSFKLQVKFFIIALIGLAINLARFWVELKNKHHQQPQKVIYYEHAQHQHHYEHEEEPGWGPWSRSIEPEEVEAELEENINSPYRAHHKNAQVYPTRPLLTLS